MHLTVLVSEMKTGRRLVILNNRRVYISTDDGRLEPGCEAWLKSVLPDGAKVEGHAFNCGIEAETPEKKIDSTYS